MAPVLVPRVINSFTGQYAFLSNFYPVPGGIVVEKHTFLSVEHAYQALKCPVHLRDERWNKYFTCTAGQAKRLGKQLPLREDWSTIKYNLMFELCSLKFNEPSLEKFLLSTENEELIEENWWGDRYWGVCKGEGENNLGKILMAIRFQKKLEVIEKSS